MSLTNKAPSFFQGLLELEFMVVLREAVKNHLQQRLLPSSTVFTNSDHQTVSEIPHSTLSKEINSFPKTMAQQPPAQRLMNNRADAFVYCQHKVTRPAGGAGSHRVPLSAGLAFLFVS